MTAKKADKKAQIKVTLRKSAIGYSLRQKNTVKGLGLGKLNGSRILEDTPAIRGMVQKVIHLVDVEEVTG
jgi:large subunit ribosomal protein L30